MLDDFFGVAELETVLNVQPIPMQDDKTPKEPSQRPTK
jgi:hypothetical protein